MESSGFLYTVSCHLQVVTILFLSNLDAFYLLFLIWFLCLGLQKSCWIEGMRVGILFSLFILEKELSACHHWYVVNCGLIYSFYYAETLQFVGNFYHKWVWTFFKAFSVSIEMIMIVMLGYVNAYHISWLVDIETYLQSME